MTKKIKIDQAAPVCPGCRRTIEGVKLTSRIIKFDESGGAMNMVSICCANDINGHPCNVALKLDLIPVEDETEIVVPEKKIEVVH